MARTKAKSKAGAKAATKAATKAGAKAGAPKLGKKENLERAEARALKRREAERESKEIRVARLKDASSKRKSLRKQNPALKSLKLSKLQRYRNNQKLLVTSTASVERWIKLIVGQQNEDKVLEVIPEHLRLENPPQSIKGLTQKATRACAHLVAHRVNDVFEQAKKLATEYKHKTISPTDVEVACRMITA